MNTKTFPSILLKLTIALALLFSAFAYTSPALAEYTCTSPVTVVKDDTLTKIAVRCGTTVAALLRANPEIKDRSKIFVGQKIVLPGALLVGTGTTDIYIIKRGDTLSSLAKTFKTTVEKLLELNKDITNRSIIYEGQRLVVLKAGVTPTPSPSPSPTPSPTPVGGQKYTVQKGDTLRILAARFSTTVDDLLRLNPDIKDKNLIYVGQKIVVPAGVQLYTVVKGDSLRSIATAYGTTVAKLLELNTFIKDADIIYVGQVLRVK